MPDNCETAVIHTSLYDSEINHAYREMARHYNIAIIPARFVKLKDKASVKSSVGWLETWLLEWLKNRIYYSFEASNHDIKERVKKLAQKPFKHRTGSMESVFTALDKSALRSLPYDKFEFFITKGVKHVPNNDHVEWDYFYYSVPYMFYSQPVSMHVYAKHIEIYSKNNERIAYHISK